METSKLKKFAQEARNQLLTQVSAKLALVLGEGSAARREATPAVQELERTINETSRSQVIEKVAYTWFNRFTALRFMDANGYTNPRVVTPADGSTRPEILADAAAGQFEAELPPATRSSVAALLDGRTPSRDAQGEAYRLLLVAACNQWHGPMPFMFEKIADYTELLMPEDLLSPDSILSRLRAAMTDDDCRDVEIIGWLYQFYISEKKDKVFADLKKNVKISAENIPAATQLFTPHWIVRYLVENSLGRLWLLNRRDSKLAKYMDYYIAPVEAETDFLRVGRPEEIKLCDPACGSGHMLTYAFDLLYTIYEEEGYDLATIPDLILTHNLYGVEIDDRAGALAAFTLVMKAAGRRRRFLRAPVQPNICVMQDVSFTAAELAEYTAAAGRDLVSSDLRETLGQFDQAKNFGALIVPKLRDVAEVTRRVAALDFESNLFLRDVHARVLQVLRMAEALSPKYHVVVANPPYMSDKYFSETLKRFAAENYKDSRFNLYSIFMRRASSLLTPSGFFGMLTLHSWMSGSKYQLLREDFIARCPTVTMAHLGAGAFDSIGGQVVSATAFIMGLSRNIDQAGLFIDLTAVDGEEDMAVLARKAGESFEQGYCFKSSGRVFRKIPGSPFVYWISESELNAFSSLHQLSEYADFRQGMATTDNGTYLRNWHELPLAEIVFGAASTYDEISVGKKWFPYNKGGGDRRWYGHNDFVVRYEDHGEILIDLVRGKYPKISDPEFVIKNRAYYFRPSVTYSALSGGAFAARICEQGYIFDTKGSCAFPLNDATRDQIAALLNSVVARAFLRLLAPTLDFNLFSLSAVPYPNSIPKDSAEIAEASRAASKSDWDAFETSWDFSTLPLLDPAHRQASLAATYAALRAHWQGMTSQMHALEEENNRIFIQAYDLEGELTPEVPLEEITLTCNPAFRYGAKKSAEELEASLLADTMREFLSYAVGCMFGRYSLDAPGLILANQGDGLAEYAARVPDPRFVPDADNVIPMLEEDWFPDDVTERFRRFLRVTFGEAGFQDNLGFIEAALGKDIRKWFTKDFFDYHVRRFKKRPIYWMFSSPKGSFNALIYMHRYRSDTVSVVLNHYLREFISKLQTERARLEKLADDPSAAQSQRTKALKDVNTVIKQIDELTGWERDVVFPLAQARIEIDLDDGVKRNYPRFGAALKAIKGLDASDDE